jgi:exonuclease SbcD
MKFLHTADWHLGQNFYQYSRIEEHAAFFQHLRDTIRAEQPDLLMVSGDIFDNAMPGVEAQEFYYTSVVSLHEACSEMQIVLIAGNHDSASRLEAPNRLWRALNVTVVGSLCKTDGQVDEARHVLPILQHGIPVAYIVALPHTYVGNLPHVEDPEVADDYSGRLQQLIQRLHARAVAMRGDSNAPIFLMAHLTALSSTSGIGWDEGVGGKEAVAIAPLADLFDYVALGHIHNPTVLHHPKACYSGAPIPVSFDENYPHGILLGTWDHSLTLRRLDYPTLIPVRRIPEQPAPAEKVLAALSDFPAEEYAYVQANVYQEGAHSPDLKERIRQVLADKKARFCEIKYTYPECESGASTLRVRDLHELRAIDPLTMARVYYEEKTGAPLSAEQEQLFLQVLAELKA